MADNDFTKAVRAALDSCSRTVQLQAAVGDIALRLHTALQETTSKALHAFIRPDTGPWDQTDLMILGPIYESRIGVFILNDSGTAVRFQRPGFDSVFWHCDIQALEIDVLEAIGSPRVGALIQALLRR